MRTARYGDLTPDGLTANSFSVRTAHPFILLRTSVLPNAVSKENNLDSHIYVVGDEQNYHFQVLKLLLGKLGFPWAEQIHHLSYGMVELPEGKMKSREGTVVDADELIAQMKEEARNVSEESGKLADASAREKEELYSIIGLGLSNTLSSRLTRRRPCFSILVRASILTAIQVLSYNILMLGSEAFYARQRNRAWRTSRRMLRLVQGKYA